MKMFQLKNGLSLPAKVNSLWLLSLFTGAASLNVHAAASNSVARVWDERALAAIRVDTPHPPAQARNLFSLSACMYDAWAAYDTTAVGYVYRGKHTAADVAAARREAISFAAYRMLKQRHFYSKTANATLALDDAQMTALGYDINNNSRDTSTPAGVGNSVFDAVSAWFLNDGARQTNGTPTAPYPDYPAGQGGYVYTNPILVTGLPGIGAAGLQDVNHWQRLAIANSVDQNGFPQGPIQNYLGAQWLGVRPFALTRTDSARPWIDPGPPPHLGGVGDEAFRTNVVEVIRRSSELTPDDGVMIDISPGAFGNNSLGANDGTGHPVNPATGLPYPSNLVNRGDFARVLAEFWADGPSSETPPGHWNVLANLVGDSPNFEKRLGGIGPVLDDLEWDVKVYFVVNAAVHEGACAAWSLKRYYDGWRPITAVRYMGGLGQSTQPAGPSYNPNGLPLVPDLIELVTTNTAAPGGRHQGLPVNGVAILAWPGQPARATNHSGVRWISPDTWLPYQKANFVTPAFPGYISGHSTFSRSAAEALTALTGSPFFPGGLGTYTVTNLSFENGPSQPVQLEWATYYDAADQAGLSRIWGGIHPPVDDFAGRIAGSQCGIGVWTLAQKYFDGSVSLVPGNSPPAFLEPMVDRTVKERKRLTFSAYARDWDGPSQTLTFTLDPGAPSGASISADGVFQWRPTEEQGPGVYPLTVRVTDNGTPSLSVTQAFNVTVTEVNSAPWFSNLRNKYTKADSLLSFPTGGDSDLPAQQLSFTMIGAPQGASIDPATGVVSWTPTDAQAPGTYSVSIHVTDHGLPPLSATASFTIHVLASSADLVVVDFSRSGNSLVLNWQATIGRVYQVQATDDLNQPNWTSFGPSMTANTTTLSATPAVSGNSNRFYRVLLVP